MVISTYIDSIFCLKSYLSSYFQDNTGTGTATGTGKGETGTGDTDRTQIKLTLALSPLSVTWDSETLHLLRALADRLLLVDSFLRWMGL